jgi:hypothetical protein
MTASLRREASWFSDDVGLEPRTTRTVWVPTPG